MRFSPCFAIIISFMLFSTMVFAVCPYDIDCIDNPYGAGSPYKSDGLLNPYSKYGNKYSNDSWTNPYANNPPKIYDSNGNYKGQFSTNPYLKDSISNPYGKYGNPYSQDSINNPYGAGNPYTNNEFSIYGN